MRRLTFLAILLLSILPRVYTQPLPFPYDQHKVDSITQLLPSMKDDTNKVNSLILLSKMYFSTGKGDMVLFYAKKADSISLKINYSIGRATALTQMAFYHATTGDWPNSLREINEAIPIVKDERLEWRVYFYNLKFINYATKNDFTTARMCALNALHDSSFKGLDEMSKWATYMQLGISYEWENQMDSAQYYANILKGYVKKYHHPDLEMNTYSLLGNIARKQKNYDEALFYYKLGDQSPIGIAWVYEEQNKLDSAIFYAKKALEIAQSKHNPLLILESTQVLAHCYNNSNPALSNQYLRLYIATRDTLFNANKIKQIEEIRLNEQQQRFDEIGKEKAFRSKIIQFSLITLAALFLISAIFFFRNNRIKKAANIQLEKANNELRATQVLLENKNKDLEIEAALDRVRSKSLQMVNTSQIGEVIFGVFSELRKLDSVLDRSLFVIFDTDLKGMVYWLAGPEGLLSQNGFHIPLFEHPFNNFMVEHFKNKSTNSIYLLAGDDKKAWDEIAFKESELRLLPEPVKDSMIHYGDVYLNMSYGNFGILITSTSSPISNHLFDLSSRFSNVFDQAYTRFLDLKRAEFQSEQARIDLIQIQAEKKKAEEALKELRITQNQLIQQEKLASLGELTAGIAHEIQNPLNFVTNFSELSVDLVKDIKEEIEKPEIDKTYVDELFDDLTQNQEKINFHGKRASRIVRGMLEHSRASKGERQLTDMNLLCDEYLRLAYHGMRAKDKSFNCDFKTYFDETLPKINVVQQDIGRVLLNLINNAFYAVNNKLKTATNYNPSVSVTTSQQENYFTITIKDNGDGIPESIKSKIFQPFFTTKPTGEGTGLGLSLSYEIITKGHEGQLKVQSTEGVGTEFIINLPMK